MSLNATVKGYNLKERFTHVPPQKGVLEKSLYL